eukprot:629977-Pelagomonas_calceolata.AAC.5
MATGAGRLISVASIYTAGRPRVLACMVPLPDLLALLFARDCPTAAEVWENVAQRPNTDSFITVQIQASHAAHTAMVSGGRPAVIKLSNSARDFFSFHSWAGDSDLYLIQDW